MDPNKTYPVMQLRLFIFASKTSFVLSANGNFCLVPKSDAEILKIDHVHKVYTYLISHVNIYKQNSGTSKKLQNFLKIFKIFPSIFV